MKVGGAVFAIASLAVVIAIVAALFFFVMLPTYLLEQTMQLFPWAAWGIKRWMLGTEDVGDEAVLAAVRFEPTGYSGPTSFLCTDLATRSYKSSDYGVSRVDSNGNQWTHAGIDLATCGHQGPTVPVRAPMGGRVLYAGWHGALGWTVVIENNWTLAVLGHMCCGEKFNPGPSSLAVSEGQIIRAGHVVGHVGTTGNSTGAHLHFEVQVCDPDTKACSAHSPTSVSLPGQTGACPWPSVTYFKTYAACLHWSGW
jgi:hypothetical protein